MAVLGFLTYAILFRTMTKDDVGSWFFFQTIYLLADTLRTGFMQTAIIKFCSGDGQEKKRYIGSGWIISIVITLIFCITNFALWIIFKNNGDSAWGLIIKYFALALIVVLPLNFSTWILQAINKFDKLLIVRLLSQGGFLISILSLFLFKQLNLNNLVYAFIITSFLTSIICILTGWSHFKYIRFFNKTNILEFYNYGKYSTGTVISTNLFKTSDTFLIKSFLGEAMLAVYKIPEKLMEVIEIPIRSFVMTAMPEMARDVNNHGQQAAAPVMMRYAGFLSLLLIPIAVGSILFSKLAVWLVGGQQYLDTQAPMIFNIFILLAIFSPIDRFLGVTLDIINKPKLNLYKVIVMLSIQFFGGYIALSIFNNIYAIAFTSVITSIAGIIFGHLSLRKYLKYTFPDIYKYGFAEIKRLWQLINKKVKLK